MSGSAPIPAVPFREAVAAWTRVALTSFGGPAGQIAVIHRVVVEEKRWVDEPRFLHALSYCMLLPGPEAQQLATYLGWLLHGTRGALVAGGLFILPGFITILALSLVYVSFRETSLLTGIFLGLKPAVFAIVLHAVWRLGKRALGNWVGLTLAIAAFIASLALRVPLPLIVVGAAALGYLNYRGRTPEALPNGHRSPGFESSRPPIATALRTATVWALIWFVPIALLLLVAGPSHTLTREGIFFSKAAVVTFGGAYAVLAYV
ncbi:MAG: chromate transporter, partial [Actinomycetota bacterium]|nr:chromate transporter [Actinomycetota bacterium]